MKDENIKSSRDRGKDIRARPANCGGQGTGRDNSGKRKANMDKDRRDEVKRKGRKRVIAIVGIAVLIILLLQLLKGCGNDDLPLSPPDYEEDASGLCRKDDDTRESADSSRINLAVMDDYTVNPDFPDFTVAYPSQNHFDIELSFRDGSQEEIYRTKRIRPGTVVAIPGYDFLEKGVSKLNVVICVYNPDTWELENEATTMKIKVTKE